MSKKKDIDKLCAYCVKAQPLADGETMLCEKNGVVACDNKCRKFRYDPLKRVPAPIPRPEHVNLSLDGEESPDPEP